jgi:two-component system nitrogen regulation response regulator GlnG
MAGLLVVDDDRSIVRIFQRCFEGSRITMRSAASGAEALAVVKEAEPDVIVLDMVLPDQSGLSVFDEIRQLLPAVPIIFITAAGSSDTTIESIQRGAMDYLRKPLDMTKIREVVNQALAIGDLSRMAAGEEGNFELCAQSGDTSDALIGRCPAMLEVYKAIGRTADQNVNVLIRGESGTGKELIARAVHQHSSRAGKTFMAVNCAAIPESLLESELFGHEKGSFTGAASQRLGKFEECDGGTLFLDEIGDMTLHMQSKVLRAIQEKEFQRVGSNKTITSDVRILAATNRDLEAMVASGEFRSDLCYRLNGYTITLPPLRDRQEDIPLLVSYYLERFNTEIGKTITGVAPETMELLKRYSWPGNIRELQTVLKRALLNAIGPILLPDFLPSELREVEPAIAASPRLAPEDDVTDASASVRPPLKHGGDAFQAFIAGRLREGTGSLYSDCLHRMESVLLTDVLSYTNGNQSQAASLLGITRGCLRSKLKAHGIMFKTSVAVRAPALAASEAQSQAGPGFRPFKVVSQ